MNRETKQAIGIAIALADGHPTPELIEKAIQLSGGRIVEAEASGEQTNNGSPPPKISRVAADRAAQQWPKHCTRCNKVINDATHADECADNVCPM